MPPRHPQIRQRKQRNQLCGVLGQATEAHLGVTKLALDHPEWMFDLGTYLRLGLLDFALGLVQRAALAQLLVSAAPRRNLPDDRAACMLGTLLDAGIAGIAADQVLFAVQQLVHLGDIGHVGRRAHHAVYQAGFAVGADVRLHAEVVLVALLGLVHLGIALAVLVLGRARRMDQRGVDDGAWRSDRPRSP